MIGDLVINVFLDLVKECDFFAGCEGLRLVRGGTSGRVGFFARGRVGLGGFLLLGQLYRRPPCVHFMICDDCVTYLGSSTLGLRRLSLLGWRRLGVPRLHCRLLRVRRGLRDRADA